MDGLFVRFFLSELRKAGFPNATYNDEQGRVIISPDYSRLFVTYEDGEYLVHYNEDSRPFVPVIKSVIGATRSVAVAWAESKPGEIAGAPLFRKLLLWNGIVLAARDDGNCGLHFVTWQYDYTSKGVGVGHYTTDAISAMRDFAGRSGLISKDRIFDDAQFSVIRFALEYRLANDGELTLDAEQEIESLIGVLERIDGNEQVR